MQQKLSRYFKSNFENIFLIAIKVGIIFLRSLSKSIIWKLTLREIRKLQSSINLNDVTDEKKPKSLTNGATTSIVNNLKESKAEAASNTEAATITNTPPVPVPTDKTNDQEEAGAEAAQGWTDQKQQRCQIQSYSETTTIMV